MNSLFNLLGQFINQQNTSSQATSPQNTINTSDYPDVFFTAQNHQSQPQQNGQQFVPQQGGMFSNLLNPDIIKNILPMFFKGGAGLNASKSLENGQPNISQIFSNFLGNKKNKNKTESNKTETVIDLSDFTEIP